MPEPTAWVRCGGCGFMELIAARNARSWEGREEERRCRWCARPEPVVTETERRWAAKVWAEMDEESRMLVSVALVTMPLGSGQRTAA